MDVGFGAPMPYAFGSEDGEEEKEDFPIIIGEPGVKGKSAPLSCRG